MRTKTGFYSMILTSVICMLGGSVFAASSVRMLGTNGKSSVGVTDATTGAIVSGDSKSGVSTTAVSKTPRASSVRFNPAVMQKTVSTSGTASYSGGTSVDTNIETDDVLNTTPARLSIGKYLNLSHNYKNVTSGGTGTGTGGGTSGADIGDLRSELDALQDQVDNLKSGKQNALLVGDGEYIDITGSDNNVISIDINALKTDLQAALGTDKDILTEIDSDYKLWWCYANTTKTACSNTKQQIVDLGQVLQEYDLVNENISLRDALAGKQGMLSEADNGFIAINQEAGTIGVKFNELKTALGIANNKTTEIRFTEDGELQWRYTDEYETDGTTKKWTTADIHALMQDSLNNYVQSQTLLDYVKKTELAGLQGALTADENGYIQIENSQIAVKFDDLKSALNIPQEREVEVKISDDGKINWRYVGDTTWHQTNESINDIIDGKLANYVLRSELVGLQGALVASDTGFLQINDNEIGIKFDDLKTALNIPKSRADIEMEITSGGILRWRYLDSFESDNTTKKWTDVSMEIGDLIDNKLVGYVKQSDLNGLQLTMSTDANGYLEINNNQINVKFDKLKQDLGIPKSQVDIEMEITSAGVLRWRYVDSFETDGTTKKWTDVSGNIGDLIDGKLASYVSNENLNTVLSEYVTNNVLNTTLQDYATKTYIDDGLATKQAILTEAENGFIAITPTDGSDTIDIKFAELKTALGIDNKKTSEIRVENGVLQWRYTDEYETDVDSGDIKKDIGGNNIKKWTNVFDLTTLLDGYVKQSDFNTIINRIDTDLAGKQIKLTPATDGYILLNEQTGEIAVDMASLRSQLAITAGVARTSELRVYDGKLQWRYTDEFVKNTANENVEVWHDLDLTGLDLPLYVQNTYLTNNYYTKTDVDNLAQTIENKINTTLEALALPDEGPTDSGLYLLSIADGEGGTKTRVWQSIKIVDGDGVVH